MRTGIILEMDESFLTLLTPEGEFLRASRKGKMYSIGQEITFEPAIQPHTKKRKAMLELAGMKKIWMSAAAALIIMASAIFPLGSGNQVYAYMSIDVNPSIELGVNEKMQVLRMNGYNKEGKKIVSGLKDWKKEDVSEVAEKILSEIGRQGYFATTNKVIISTVKTGEKEEMADLRLDETIREISEAAKREEHEVTVVSATAKDLKEAHKRGVTTGHYKVGAVAKQQGNAQLEMKDDPASSESAVPSDAGKSSAPGQIKKADPVKPVVPVNPESKGNGPKNPKDEDGKGKHEGKQKENKNSQKGNHNNTGNGSKKNGNGNGKGNGKGNGNEQKNGNSKGDNQGKKGSDVKGGDPEQKKDNKNEKNSVNGNGSQKPNAQSKQGKSKGQNKTPDENSRNGQNGNKQNDNKGNKQNDNKGNGTKGKSGENSNKQDSNGQKNNSNNENRERKDPSSKNDGQKAKTKSNNKEKSGK
ncbi:anti-sigma factor domain-containing protein [Bacillus sp. FJAT-27245]|uniref:anti-sigma factor domain-containing protein n=1 Tax=Bacillus sp. FJAT-27245 TaxID=1684144 RepID=UPI0006A76E9F|nr:anti-sigma factor domain-containing protein [Bacillus sp. FJAT-27245]